MLYTGDEITGRAASDLRLALKSVAAEDLDPKSWRLPNPWPRSRSTISPVQAVRDRRGDTFDWTLNRPINRPD